MPVLSTPRTPRSARRPRFHGRPAPHLHVVLGLHRHLRVGRPRFTPFHGGFGLLNYQDIRKPAFFAYQFLNRLGPRQLESTDPASYVTTDDAGNLQVLLWDFTVTNPKTENDQVFYDRDLSAAPKGTARVQLTHVPPGRYTQTVYQVGYRVNDAYAAYKDLGSPAQLTRAQVQQINAASDGKPVDRATVTVGPDGTFQR